LKGQRLLILLLALVLGALAYPVDVHASPVTVVLSPSSQVVPQGTITTVAIALTGAPPGTPPGTSGYDLSLTGFQHGSTYTFSPGRVPTAGGSGGSILRIDTSSSPLYCPGTYQYTVTATNTTIPDSGSASGSITVTQVGPALSLTITTDKSAYRIGDNVTIQMTASRPAEGRLTISGASSSVLSFLFSTPPYSVTRTLTVSTVGRYTLTFEADDFCNGFSSSVAYFDVTPDTYSVSISIDGVPSTVSIPLTVDGQEQGTVGGSEVKKLSFKLDTSHTIAVAHYVTGDVGVRYYAAQNAWTAASAGNHVFSYAAEYLLTVTTDPNGVPIVNSTGWYREGSTIQTGLAPQTAPGPTGMQYLFIGWEVDGVPQSGNPISIMMNEPHQVVARYQIQPLVSVTSTLATTVTTSTTQSQTSSNTHTTSTVTLTLPPPVPSSWIFALITLGTVFSIILISAVAVVRLGIWRHGTQSRTPQSQSSTLPSHIVSEEHPNVTDLDQKLYNYITEHGGTISLSTASGELGATIDEIKASIERLKRAGKISPQ
jgi:hypothetical protein